MDLIAQTEIRCPHCGQTFPLEVDTSVEEQIFVEDCNICCRPMTLTIHSEPGTLLDVTISDEVS
jgi:hypothetical protein